MFPTSYSSFQDKFVLSFVSKLTRIEPFKIEPKCFAEQFKDDTCHKKVTIEMLGMKIVTNGLFSEKFQRNQMYIFVTFLSDQNYLFTVGIS